MARQKFQFRPGVLRYFLILGIFSFAAYLYFDGKEIFLALLGPALYLATVIAQTLEKLGLSIPQQDLTCLLPSVLLYFGLFGFLFRKLMDESPLHRILSMAGLAVFMGYLHYLAWKNLLLYSQKPF